MNCKFAFITLCLILAPLFLKAQPNNKADFDELVELARKIEFQLGKTKLISSVDVSIFPKMAAIMINNSTEFEFEISSHTSSIGSKQLNKQLSQERADLLRTVFVDYGVDSSILTAIGKGEDKPIAPNKTREGRELNRRIEVRAIPRNKN